MKIDNEIDKRADLRIGLLFFRPHNMAVKQHTFAD